MSENYTLYKYDTCPYCRLVRTFVEQNGIELAYRDVHRDPGAMAELRRGGGRSTVPCLKIERGDQVDWMYESMDIIGYLGAQAGAS